jgi:2-oxoglutarate dehydrogenase E2 component (dihydrolipoamide succinyltransferase)
MSAEVRIPPLGESVTTGVIARWVKQDGDHVTTDEPILELETDKATMEIPATAAGRLRIVEPQGATVKVGSVVARIEAAETPPAAASTKPAAAEPTPLAPAVRKMVAEHGLDAGDIAGTGKGGRLTKEDVVRHLEARQAEEPPDGRPAPDRGPAPAAPAPAATAPVEEETERVPMTTLRRRIAERLVEAQQTAAILTTFNEIDCSAVMAARRRYRERFRSVHGVDLGLMSLFARAVVLALHDVPVVNARIEGDDIVYSRAVHLGIAVASPRGLVVPVVRHAHRMTLADLERAIDVMASRARDGTLVPDDLYGGTFTITNGGVFGSLLSTPILNPPQSGVLGMHRIQDRPVAVDGQVTIRPMMYVALSYDHRLVDGQQAVTFLVRVKERLEDPLRMLLEV